MLLHLFKDLVDYPLDAGILSLPIWLAIITLFMKTKPK
jgi:hypothetical protein